MRPRRATTRRDHRPPRQARPAATRRRALNGRVRAPGPRAQGTTGAPSRGRRRPRVRGHPRGAPPPPRSELTSTGPHMTTSRSVCKQWADVVWVLVWRAQLVQGFPALFWSGRRDSNPRPSPWQGDGKSALNRRAGQTMPRSRREDRLRGPASQSPLANPLASSADMLRPRQPGRGYPRSTEHASL